MRYIFIGLAYALGVVLGGLLIMSGAAMMIEGDHPEGLLGHLLMVAGGGCFLGMGVVGVAVSTENIFKYFKGN
jgi:hypothetical protein|tara:strand:+ start:394 stop:612 length:219 start_codon:yes stop_codon:yes gene_type:complete